MKVSLLERREVKHQNRKQHCFSPAVESRFANPSPGFSQGQVAQWDTGSVAEIWAQVAPATRATSSSSRKTWKQENTSHDVVRGVLALARKHKEGWLETWHPKHPKPSPCWLHLHFLICYAEMNKTNLSVEDCEELQIKAWNTYEDD